MQIRFATWVRFAVDADPPILIHSNAEKNVLHAKSIGLKWRPSFLFYSK